MASEPSTDGTSRRRPGIRVSSIGRNGDVRYQTDFRSVYARVLDHWLGTDSTTVLGADFRNPGLTFLS